MVQVHLFERNKLANNIASFASLKATPPLVKGAGVTGILSGAGTLEYWNILIPKPIINTKKATVKSDA